MIKNRLIQLYGNRGFIFDLGLSIILLVIISFISFKVNFDYNSNLIMSLISFLGILAGFMLTAFSLLLLYNPKEQESPKFFLLRKSNAFKYALKYFISSILIILITITLLFINLAYPSKLVWLGLLFIILSILMLIRCLYYLFAIIDFE